jgi:hypothetical protein
MSVGILGHPDRDAAAERMSPVSIS